MLPWGTPLVISKMFEDSFWSWIYWVRIVWKGFKARNMFSSGSKLINCLQQEALIDFVEGFPKVSIYDINSLLRFNAVYKSFGENWFKTSLVIDLVRSWLSYIWWRCQPSGVFLCKRDKTITDKTPAMHRVVFRLRLSNYKRLIKILPPLW